MNDYYTRQYHRSWWRDLSDQPLLNRTRLRFIGRAAIKGGRLLELGAGQGHFIERASRAGYDTVAVELLPEGVSSSARHSPTSSVIQGSASAIPVKSNLFDIAVAWDVLEHVAEPGAAVAELSRVTKPGALVCISTPNPDALSARHRGDDTTAGADPTHVSILSRDQWVEQFEHYGFSLLKSGGDAWWDPPYPLPAPKWAWSLLSQAMFASRMYWPWPSLENLVFAFRNGKPS